MCEIRLPVSAFQKRTVPFRDRVANRRLSLLNAASTTEVSSPLRKATSSPVSVSQIDPVLSSPYTVRSRRLSELKTVVVTDPPPRPASAKSCSPLSASQMCTDFFSDLVSTRLPSGKNVADKNPSECGN